jgi:integrase
VPRPRPPHLNREETRHGRVVWFVRIGKGPRTRIRGEYGTAEFLAAYRAAIAGQPQVPTSKEFSAKTFGWLAEQYRQSTAWSKLSLGTRRQRESILRAAVDVAGHESIQRITRTVIVKSIERRKLHAQRHFLQTMRGLFQWAVRAQHANTDPTAGLKAERRATPGYHVWTEDEVATFEARWPLGTRERLAFDVLLYTGLRRGDAVALGRQHIKNGTATIRTEKTGEIVTLPILAPLQASIDAGPTGDLNFIVANNGRAMKKESFGNWFAEVCRKTGVPGRAHGLRKCGATRAANNGATDAQLEAMFGWKRGSKEAAVYTRNADRARLAKAGAAKLLAVDDGDQRTG